MAKGGFTGAVPPRETSPEEYSGVWDITEQYGEQKAGSWPFQAADCAPKSLRFDSASSAYLSKTPAAAGNRKTWTISLWLKRCKLGALQSFTSSNNDTILLFDSSDRLCFYQGTYVRVTTQVFRDCSAWYHILLAVDTTNATAQNRARIYVNGTEITTWTTNTTITQNQDTNWNAALAHQINANNNAQYGDLYIADVHSIDGQALDPTNFGFYDGAGIWQPKRFTGDYASGPVYSNFVDNQATGNIISNPSAKGPQVMFDGQLNTLTNIASGYVEIDLSSFGLVADSNGVEIYNTEAGAYTSYQINGGTAVNWGGTAGWQSFGGAGAVNTIRMNYLSGGNVNVAAAIRINGQILTDASVGRNSFHLDFSDGVKDQSGLGNDWTPNNITVRGDGTIYSNSLTSTATFSASNPASYSFDGDIDSLSYVGGSAAEIVWAPPGGYSYSEKVEIYTGGIQFFRWNLNGGGWNTATSSTWTTVATGSGTITTLSVDRNGSSTHGFYAIRIDNQILVDGQYSDFFVDSPVNGNEASTGAGGERRGNYATLNPLDCQSNNGALSNGNLDIKQTATNWAMYRSTMFVSSGKYYWEVTLGNNQYSTIGICSSAYQMANSSNNWANAGSEMFGYYPYDGNVYNGSNTISYATGDTSASGSVIGVALDLDNGTLAFYKDGTSLGQATSGLVGQSWSPTHWLYSQTNADSYNFGQRSFSQTPPAGYSPLATSFLPEPTIKRGDEAMDVALYEGNGTSQTIDNLRLSPGLVWIKNRDGSYNHVLFDVVRGAGGSKVLFSNRTTAEGGGTGEEGAAYGHVSSFNDDGFTVAKGTGNPLWVSNSSQSYVSWVWDAGDTTTTIAAGSLNSSAYDQSQNWSSYGDTNDKTNESWEHIFDGNGVAAPHMVANSGSTAVWTPTTAISFTKLELYANNDGVGDITLNNSISTTGTIPVGGGGNIAWTDVTHLFTNKSLSSIEVPNSYNSDPTRLGGIRIDGKLLVDSGVSVTNVPSIASTVRANPAAGFSIATYTSPNNSNAQSFAHGLNSKPELVIIKNRDTTFNWDIYHGSLGYNSSLTFTTAATRSGAFSAEPTSFVVNTQTNYTHNGTDDYVAYCISSIEGYSALGKYRGAGTNDQVFIYTGFRPQWLMIKRISGALSNWLIFDRERTPLNPAKQYLRPNVANSENTFSEGVNFKSNGFHLNGLSNNSELNANAADYLYIAFAEHPFASNCRAL